MYMYFSVRVILERQELMEHQEIEENKCVLPFSITDC